MKKDTDTRASAIQRVFRERYAALLRWHKITHEYYTRHLPQDDRNALAMCFQGRLKLYNGLVPKTNGAIISLTPSDASFLLQITRLLSTSPKVPHRIALSRYVDMGRLSPKQTPKEGSTLPHMLPFSTTLREGFAVFWSSKGAHENKTGPPPCCLLRIHVHQGAQVYFWGPTPDNRLLARTRMAKSLFEKVDSQFEVLLPPATLKVTKVTKRNIEAMRKHAPGYVKHLEEFDVPYVNVYDCVIEPIKLEMLYCKSMEVAERITGSQSLKGRILLSAPDMLPKTIKTRIAKAAAKGQVVIVPVSNNTPTLDEVEGYDATDVIEAIDALQESLQEIDPEEMEELIELDDMLMSLPNDFPFIQRHMQPLNDLIKSHGSLHAAYETDSKHVDRVFRDLKEAVQQPVRRANGIAPSPVTDRDKKERAQRHDALERAKASFVKGFAKHLEPICLKKRVMGVSLVPCTRQDFVLGKENDGVYKGMFNYFGGKIEDKIQNEKRSASAMEVAEVLFEEAYEEIGIVLTAEELKKSLLSVVQVPFKDPSSVSIVLLTHMTGVEPDVWKAMMRVRMGRSDHKYYEMSEIRSFPWALKPTKTQHLGTLSAYVKSAHQTLVEALSLVKHWPEPVSIDEFPTVRIDEYSKPVIVSPPLRTPPPISKKSQQKQCPKEKILNVKTNRCVLKLGRIGRAILAKKDL
jgi:hypothetical protein